MIANRLILTAALMVVMTACGRKKKEVQVVPAAGVLPEIVAEAGEPVVAGKPPPLDPAVPALTINKSAQVSVLGYHDFVKGKPGNAMQVSEEQFRAQMQVIRDARIKVIGMPEFLAWRRGEKDIPDPSILITMDDGWKSVHTIALPVLREFGYPFTVFLYKRFVNGGSKSMTTAEIRELMAAGGILITAPMFLISLLVQKQFIQSLTAGSVR
jgi:hypothetical protein